MSTKLSIEQANEFLSKIGVEVAVVADSEAADKNPDIELMAKAAVNEPETRIRHEIELEVKEAARKEEAGKQLGSLRRVLKRHFGLDEKEMAELSMEDMVKLGKDKSTANKQDADSDLAVRLENAKKEWEAEKETLAAQYTREKAELEDKFVSRDMEEHILSIVNNMPRVGGDPVMQAKAIFTDIKNKFNTKYDPDKKEILFFEKSNPEKRIFDGNNIVSDKYHVEKYMKSMGLYASDTRQVSPADVLKGEHKDIKPGIGKVDETDPMKFLEATFQQA